MKILFCREKNASLPVEIDLSQNTLTQDIEKTRYALENAYAGFDNATEPEMIDCYIFEVNSLLKRYAYLTKLAQKERVPVKELNPKSPVYALVRHVLG